MPMNWGKSEAPLGTITVTVANQSALLEDVAHRLEIGSGFSIATLNLDHVVKLRRDPGFHQAYAEQSHVTADGNPIVWLSRLAGHRQVTLLPGSELIEPLSALAARKGVPVAFLGSSERTLTTAADALEARHPGLQVVLTLSPSFGFDPDGGEADEAINTIAESGARLAFLALGAPKQERFAARAQKRLPQVGFVSIGAGLDFVAGSQVRAPGWVRAIAAEWLWRMLSDPRRLAGRYAACAAILPGLAVEALQARRKSPS